MSLQLRRQATKSQQQTSAAQQEAQQVDNATSVQLLEAMVDVAVGCITYLRSIFPDAFYEDDKVNIAGVGSSQGSGGVRVKKLQRGRNDEADRLLDWVEHGVRDALKRRYLKTFMLAIYADPDKPTEIIECYSFNFTYTRTTIAAPDGSTLEMMLPEMSISDELNQRLQIAPGGYQQDKVYTVREVKLQIQALTKQLIVMTQTMADLPRRRYLTIKLLYQDHTPADYEPPGFRAGDVDKDRFHLLTPNEDDEPERVAFGQVHTGHHKLSINLVSVAQYVKGAEQPPQPSLDQQLAFNRAEATHRNVLWDAEKPARADSDTEEGMMQVDDSGAFHQSPQGVRDPVTGVIKPVIRRASDEMRVDEPFVTQAESFSPALELASQDGGDEEMLRYTVPHDRSLGDSRSEITAAAEEDDPIASQTTVVPARDDDGDLIEQMGETLQSMDEANQVAGEGESIRDCPDPAIGSYQEMPDGPKSTVCDCGDYEDDGAMLGCDHCDTLWMHGACYGFLPGTNQPKGKFYCYPCRLRQAVPPPISPQRQGEIESGLENLRSLALYRRALVLIYDLDTLPTARELAKEYLKCNLPIAADILKRLQSDGYIVDENKRPEESQSLGIFDSESVQRKKSSKRHLKPKLAANRVYEQKKLRNDAYFTPGKGEELVIWNDMGLQPYKNRVVPLATKAKQAGSTGDSTSRDVDTVLAPETFVSDPSDRAEHSNARRRNKRDRSLDQESQQSATPTDRHQKRQKISVSTEQLTTYDAA